MVSLKTVFIYAFIIFGLFIGNASATIEINSSTTFPYSLATAGEYYVLTENVTSEGTAFNVNANNITFDGQNYTITYGSTGAGYGLYAATKNNITLKNAKLVTTNTTSTAYAIYFNAVNNSMVDYVNTSTISSDTIYVTGGSSNNVYKNLAASSVSRAGIKIVNSLSINNTLENVTAWSTSYVGVSIETGYNNMSNIRGYSNSSNGFAVNSGSNNNINGVIAVSTSAPAITFLNGANDNIISNCYGTSSTGYGISIQNATGNTLSDSIATSDTNVGLILTTNANDNDLENVTGYSRTKDGIRVISSIQNDLVDCIGESVEINGFDGNGIQLEAVHNSTFINCTGETRDGRGWIIRNTTYNEMTDCTGISEGWLAIQFGTHGALSYNNTFTRFTAISPHATTGQPQLMCFGDSITLGWADSQVTYGKALNESLHTTYGTDWDYVSAIGIGGDKTVDDATWGPQAFAVFEPDVVLIHLGTNDMLVYGEAGITDCIANMSIIIDYARSVGAKPYILEIIPCKADGDTKIQAYNEAFRVLAEEKNVITIQTWDAIDLHPNNGVYDGFDATQYDAGGVHPTDAGYTLMGQYIARVVDSWTRPYYGNELSNIVYANGSVEPSRDVISTDTRIPFVVTPSSDFVNVAVSTWTTDRKVWNESSDNHTVSTAHTIGGFPANTDIDIYRDGIDYAAVHSNSNGYITWVYSGGFSEHTFEAMPHPTAGMRDSFINSWSNTVSMVGAIIVISLAGSMIMMFRGKKDLSEVMNDLPGIILIVVLLVTGAIIFGQF